MWILPQTDCRELPVLVLAYVGDAVYELYVRTYLVSKGYRKVQKLHEYAAGIVCASKQAYFLRALNERLTEEEKAVARRGRNAKTGHVPKNAEVQEYHYSTAFETLLGYLFLQKQEERIAELMKYLFDLWEKDLTDNKQ